MFKYIFPPHDDLTQFNNKTILFCQVLGHSVYIAVFLTNLASLLASNPILNPVNTQLQTTAWQLSNITDTSGGLGKDDVILVWCSLTEVLDQLRSNASDWWRPSAEMRLCYHNKKNGNCCLCALFVFDHPAMQQDWWDSKSEMLNVAT